MRLVLPLALLAIFVLGPSAALTRPVARDDFAISLERSACFGRCPAYKLRITADGAVTFDGETNVARPGHHRARISRVAVRRLRQMVVDARFMGFRPLYDGGVTDVPTTTVSVTLGGVSHTVVNRSTVEAGLPQTMPRIEAAIDEAAGVARWVGRQ